MRKKLLLILALTVLVASLIVGCGEGSPCSTLTILSITEGEVLIMKEGANDWVGAVSGTELDIGDTVKTGGNSSAEITFFDGSTMELGAGTEIEILALDIVCSSGVTTITLAQMIGDTISRVTGILDPASSYEVETPSGVVGVRGSSVEIHVFRDNWHYEDGTTIAINLEGTVYAIAQGVEKQIPEGGSCIMLPDQEPNLMPVAAPDFGTTLEYHRITVPVLDNDYDLDVGDILTVASVTQGDHGQVFNNGGNVTYAPDPDFHGIDKFDYTVSDGNGGTDTATVTITVATVETFADIGVATQQAPSGYIYIWDETSNWWAIDEDTGYEIRGIYHETNMTITVAAGRRYYIWVHLPEVSYFVYDKPGDWTITDSPVGDYEAAYGYAYASLAYNVYFSVPS